MLGEQQVQPLQAVGAGDGDDPAVAAVDDDRRAGHGALLGEGVAAVGGHGVVEVVFGEGHDECSSAGGAAGIGAVVVVGGVVGEVM